jgi:hypothetical protein
MPPALDWPATARACFRGDRGSLARGLPTGVFAPVVGPERIHHLDEMEDPGFALLTGGRRRPSRASVGGWRRHLPRHEVDAFCRRTGPWQLLRGVAALVGYDEHAIPRWTHKFHVRKGHVTTRNKYMRCEKLFHSFELLSGRSLAVRATPGDRGLIDLAVPLVRQTLARGRPDSLHASFDAGAGRADAGVRALWDPVAEEHPQPDVTLRACRYPHRTRARKALPGGLFVPSREPGPYAGAPPRAIRLAGTSTVLKGESAEQAVRTAICRGVVPGPRKDRWHPLFATGLLAPDEVPGLFRRRRGHEQGYRVGVYDEFLDAVPCGCDGDGPDPKRPRCQRGPLPMIGRLVASAYDAAADRASALAGDWAGSRVRALRRAFFNRPGVLYETPEALIVRMDPFRGREGLVPVIDKFNAAGHRLPWLENRQVVVSLTPRGQPRAGPCPLIVNI